MEKKNGLWTIPNLLSLVRLCLIPVFMWLYCVKQDSLSTAIVLILSGITDIVDGYIARRFNMVSDIGKALDPIADKISRFPAMKLPFGLLLVKEAVLGISSLIVIRKTDKVHGAIWHGKVTTMLLYATMILHLLWPAIPKALSIGTIAACVVMMMISFVLYALRNVNHIRETKAE